MDSHGREEERRMMKRVARPSMIVVALVCGLAVGCGGGGGSAHFDESMVVASKTSGANTTEQTRAIALAPGLNESDAKKVAGECATQLGKNRGNGATCSLYASRGALDSASYNDRRNGEA